jgi:hypothetical protein
MQRVVPDESTKNLLCEDLDDPVKDAVKDGNIRNFFAYILTDNYYSHNNFKIYRGQNRH